MALYNLYAEQSVLGSILIEPKSVLVTNQFNLSVDDFFHPQHQIIYNCIKKLHDSGDAIDFITLKHNLEKADLLEKAGGVSYFTSLTSAVPTTKNIDYHIKILKELATKRNIYNLISDKAKTIKKMDGQDMIKLANEVKATILDSPCVDDLFIDASDITLDTTPSPSIQTGFAPLDSVTSGGLNFGTLTVLTGSPGSGKSTFLNQILANALSLGFNSFLYSGELTAQMALDWFYKTVANPIQHREPHVFDISGASEIANLSDYILNATRDNDRDNETTYYFWKTESQG